jgi:hypothetical protein
MLAYAHSIHLLFQVGEAGPHCRLLTCRHPSGNITWPAADALGAARQLAELATSAEAGA